jgi:class 3 adenylate cyclase/ketosteroid isomerase-like protein
VAEQHRACASCGTANEEDASFCEGCGAPLERACATCGVKASATARFCRACGALLDGGAAPAFDTPAAGPARKTVTVMFADLAGSTTFEEQVDAETAREVMNRYHELLRSTADRHRAGVTKYIGDGFMAVWGVPEMGPDDADHAVAAAVDLQEHFVDFAAHASAAHDVELALRVAVNTGEVVVGAGDADLVGDALNVGARLEAECPRGQVVVGEETWRATRGRNRYDSLGQVQVKGRTAVVSVYQWQARQAEATEWAPFVGRADELRRLSTALDDAVAARAARLVTVIGDPGVGKSRLAAEFVGSHRGGLIEARCDLEGTVALAPIVEVLRTRDLDADIPADAPERERILRDLRGLTTGIPGSVEETFWALRRFVEVLARDGPLIVVVDDIQWADALLHDFIEHLVEWVQEVPVLVLALARPELREVRADLVAVSRWVIEAIHLGGLDAGATAELAAGVLGAARLPADLLDRLPSSTGGNPLFVRELIGMLVHDGVLIAEPAGWQLAIDADAIAIPPTIHALLASRLERLNAKDRRVLELASVVGTDFSLGAVCALAERAAAEIRGSLDRLRRLELAQPSGTYLGNEPVWRFHHVLIRDVAYRRLLKSDRADLHERVANWVETGGVSGAFDAEEMIARHLEAAHGYLLELGQPNDRTSALAIRSARCYLASARRALDRDELISAGTQAARGAALAACDGTVHAELLLVGCEAFLSAGDVAAGAPLVDDLDRIAGEALAPWATCYRCQFVVYTEPMRLLEVDDRLQHAIDEFGRRRDPAGLAKAHRVRASTRFRLGRIGDAEADLFEALIAARRGGDHRQITAALGAAPSAALWGPSPVPKAGGRCLDVVRMQRMTTAAPSLEATSLRCLAVLELLRGRPDKARSMLADARHLVAELGLRHGLMETELFAGIIEAMEGDPAAAEPHFRTALEGLGALGVGADAGQAAALLARAVLAQGRIDEADGYAAESERLAGHNLKSAIAWRAVRAELLSAQGRHDAAVGMARDSVAVAAGTDLVLDHAEACLALGRVLGAAGDESGASAARRDAAALYLAKEVATSVARPVEPAVAEGPPQTSRLPITNLATERVEAALRALQTDGPEGYVAAYSDQFVYDDRRRLPGDPIVDHAGQVAAVERILKQYPHFEYHTVAVRGERSHLGRSRFLDDAGNETGYLHVCEVDVAGQIAFDGRFDGTDFDGAYGELEHRYYTGEGAAFATSGEVVSDFMAAMDRGDIEALRQLALPEFRWLGTPSTLTLQDGTLDDMCGWLAQRSEQVSSTRSWLAALRWVTPSCVVGRGGVRAIGPDGENHEWSSISVAEFRDGRFASVRNFDGDEDAAFAYAETLVAAPSQLMVDNLASQVQAVVTGALQRSDISKAVDCYADDFTYDDRRRLAGDHIDSRKLLQANAERICAQYARFERRTLAVRGERVQLSWSRWSDAAGNETTYLHVIEVADDGKISYEGRFDDDDFEGAYRELDRRYYAGEGTAFATNGQTTIDFIGAMDRLDVDTARQLSLPEFRYLGTPSTPTLVGGSLDEMFTALSQRLQQVSSTTTWIAVARWLNPSCLVGRGGVRAIGLDGEAYEWPSVYVAEFRDGWLASMRQFDGEEAAFSYAETLAAPRSRRLAVSNRASATSYRVAAALTAHDVEAAVGCYASEQHVYDDRRRLSGDPVRGEAQVRLALNRIHEQYSRYEVHMLAVRGERLTLNQSRMSDDSGNETVQLHVGEVGEDGRVTYEGRFDEDDFEGAYRELERRYYTGEGAAFAEAGLASVEWVTAVNRGDLDRAFGEFTTPDAHFENRSHTAFPDPSVSDPSASYRELTTVVASVRTWVSAVCWVSQDWGVGRLEREAVGRDGEPYAWTWLNVCASRDGQFVSGCLFDPEDEEQAFAYAEERARTAVSRLAVTNRASRTHSEVMRALQSHDVGAALRWWADDFSYDDQRRIGSGGIEGKARLARNLELVCGQYSMFARRTLAVRGERVQLSWSHWSDDAGNESKYLHVIQVDDEARIVYQGVFDEDDFESAYREFERRYHAGEGSSFAESGTLLTEILNAMNRNDFDRMFTKLVAPDLHVDNRTRTAFPNRSATELRASFDDLGDMVSSVRTWLSATCWQSSSRFVARLEREAVGPDGERYEWSRLVAGECQAGRLASLCEFEVDDEEHALTYAEQT